MPKGILWNKNCWIICCKIWQGSIEVGWNTKPVDSPTSTGVIDRKRTRCNQMTLSWGQLHKTPNLTNYPPADCWFFHHFYWQEATDKNWDPDKLQRGLYLNMLSCSAANREHLDVNGFDRHVCMRFGVSFVFVLICVRHIMVMGIIAVSL